MQAPNSAEDRVRVGSKVRVQDGSLDEWWRIVPSHEADASRRQISEDTPLAKALLGHGVGERVHVNCPGAIVSPVTILAVDSTGDWG
jgi:transcription elongation factor GreA